MEELLELAGLDLLCGDEQLHRYAESYPIFEVITHLSLVTRTEEPPSGVYRRHGPRTLNLHMSLYRAFNGSMVFPDVLREAMWELFVLGEDGCRQTWRDFCEEDPLVDCPYN